MENITIVNFSKGPCEFKQDLFASTPKEKLGLSILPRLIYSSDSDYVGLQFDITVTSGDVQIFKSGFLIGMEVRGWSEMLKSGVNLTNDRHKLYSICQAGWFVATGIIADQTKGLKTSELILPPIDIAKFTKEVLLISSDNQSSSN